MFMPGAHGHQKREWDALKQDVQMFVSRMQMLTDKPGSLQRHHGFITYELAL